MNDKVSCEFWLKKIAILSFQKTIQEFFVGTFWDYYTYQSKRKWRKDYLLEIGKYLVLSKVSFTD